jgi:hypothetical protein
MPIHMDRHYVEGATRLDQNNPVWGMPRVFTYFLRFGVIYSHTFSKPTAANAHCWAAG